MPYIPQTLISSGGGAGALTQIADQLLAVDTASFDVSGIAGTYSALLIIGDLRGATAAAQCDIEVRFNGDSGTNYDSSYTFFQGSGTTAASPGNGLAHILAGLTTADSGTAGRSGAFQMLVPNYASTTFHKNTRSETAYTRGVTVPGDSIWTTGVGLWKNTAAITRITVLPSAGDWKASSRLTVYGCA